MHLRHNHTLTFVYTHLCNVGLLLSDSRKLLHVHWQLHESQHPHLWYPGALSLFVTSCTINTRLCSRFQFYTCLIHFYEVPTRTTCKNNILQELSGRILACDPDRNQARLVPALSVSPEEDFKTRESWGLYERHFVCVWACMCSFSHVCALSRHLRNAVTYEKGACVWKKDTHAPRNIPCERYPTPLVQEIDNHSSERVMNLRYDQLRKKNDNSVSTALKWWWSLDFPQIFEAVASEHHKDSHELCPW